MAPRPTRLPSPSWVDHPLARSGLPKHWVVTGYVCEEGKVLLLHHRKLKMWLPPGGHVERGEDPLRALVREVHEETGLLVEPVSSGEPDLPEEDRVLPLPTPHHVQVERIDGRHEHIDLVYLCRPVGGSLRANPESLALRWFGRQELPRAPLTPTVRRTALSALRILGEGHGTGVTKGSVRRVEPNVVPPSSAAPSKSTRRPPRR